MATEQMGHAYAALWRQPVTMFRFFTVYGPWGRPDMAFFKFTDAILNGRTIDIYNHGRMERDFTYVEDLVDRDPAPGGLRAGSRAARSRPTTASARPAPSASSISAMPSRCSLLDFIAAIERACGREAIRNYMPMQPGEVLKTWADTSLLQALTGYLPSTGIGPGVAAFVAWFRAHYGL